jgi:hypothetical protein
MERPVFADTDSGSGSGDEDLEGKMSAEETPGLAYEWWHPDEFPGWTYGTGWQTGDVGRNRNQLGVITLPFLLLKSPFDQVTMASMAAASAFLE